MVTSTEEKKETEYQNEQDEADAMAREAQLEVDKEREDPHYKEKEQPEESKEEPVEKQPEEEESEPEEETEEEEESEETEEESEEEESEEEESTEEKSEEPDEKVVEEAIRTIAVDESMTIDEAKTVYAGRQGIIEKYGNDPVKMAKALQSTQSAYDKQKAENEKIMERPQVDEVEALIKNQEPHIQKYVEDNEATLIEGYQKSFPARSANMSDDEILEAQTERVRAAYTIKVQERQQEIKATAATRRKEVLSELSDSDKEFLPEIKSILQNSADSHILSKAFKVEDVVSFVRGQKYTPEYIEQIKKEAVDKALANKKIIADKTPSGPAGKKSAKKATDSPGLSTDQKNRAMEMFPDMTDKDALSTYLDMYKDEIKKNPRFVG